MLLTALPVLEYTLLQGKSDQDEAGTLHNGMWQSIQVTNEPQNVLVHRYNHIKHSVMAKVHTYMIRKWDGKEISQWKA